MGRHEALYRPLSRKERSIGTRNTVTVVQSDVQPQSLRIDDLAYLANVPSRTIRFYNTQGLLPPPQMRGRVAYYDQGHLLILGLIRDLKEKQNLPLEVIKQLLEIRRTEGEVQMNLALKQRTMRAFGGGQLRFTQEEVLRQSGVSLEELEDYLAQGLLFPLEGEESEGLLFTGDDILLLNLYRQLASLGLPIALPALIRFQLRQLVRSEVAACEQHLLPQWRAAGLPLEQQTEQFEKFLTLTDTLISIMHRRLVYQDS